jgi:hypothetical protein
MTIENQVFVWTKHDYEQGWCRIDQIGKAMDAGDADQQQSPADQQPAEPDQLLSDDMFEHEFAEYRRNPTEYKARNPPALTVKLLATAEDRRIRSQAKPDWLVDALSPKVIAGMSSDDLKRFVLHRTLEGLSEDQQAEALAGFDSACRIEKP